MNLSAHSLQQNNKSSVPIFLSTTSALLTLEKIKEQITSCPKEEYKIFVATDDAFFLQGVIDLYGDRVVYIDGFRSSDGNPLHGNSAYSPYIQGKEAIIDCMLLSLSDVMIRTQSNLNEISAAWNLNLTVIDAEPQSEIWIPKVPSHNYLNRRWIQKHFRR